MANAKRDENRTPTLLATSNSDGSTPVLIKSTDHGIHVSDGTGGSDVGGDHALRDTNRVPVLIAVSSSDGVTPVAVYADPATGYLLVQDT